MGEVKDGGRCKHGTPLSRFCPDCSYGGLHSPAPEDPRIQTPAPRPETGVDPIVKAAEGLTREHLMRTILSLQRRLRAAESERDRLREALREDAAGEPVVELLRKAADIFREWGGGPMQDRLSLAADAIDAALAPDATEGKEKG